MTDLCTENGQREQAAEAAPEAVLYTPRFDVAETDDALILYGDLPGVDRNDLQISYEDRELSIHGKVAARHPDKEHVRSEYGIGDFRRSFAIGEAVEVEQITAELKNGVLTIRLPKSAAVRSRRIEVKGG
jgi:HSP20 family molecular chaperone IbpA